MSKFTTNEYYNLLCGRHEPAAKPLSVPDYAYNPLNHSGELYEPIIDRKWAENNSLPRWPEGKRFAVCLTHDVDAVSGLNLRQNLRAIGRLVETHSNRSISESLRRIVEHKINALRGLIGQDDNMSRFEKWLDYEEEQGVRSTFFFAPDRVNLPHSSDCMYKFDQEIKFRGKSTSIKELIRTMDKGGWEIGLHPSWNAHNSVEEMTFQKTQLESVLGHKIYSVRQHFLKFDPQTTPATQSSSGFKYDGTLGYNDNIGFRRGSSYPIHGFDLKLDQQLPIIHIPMIVQDGAFMPAEKGMRLDIPSTMKYIQDILEEVRKVGGVLTLSWHPHAVNRPGYWEMYKNVVALIRNDDPWFATLGQIGEWWSDNVKIDLLKYTKSIS